ncbi:MAG: methylated-DNA--[protein]-cysteine S-methyltransferase [Synergistaceae bacterium]|nr:methylated-DNA--[protein]-cysteine S-methyltransferase [Synergistaceae bacterium]
MKNFFYYEFDVVGRLRIGEEDGRLTDLHFERSPDMYTDSDIAETPLLFETHRQLSEYFTGERKNFDLPLMPKGTDFQLRCWSALLKIPYAETRSYGDIARAVGRPKGFRAVGMANNRNPIAIIIPCHRVIGSDGKLVGFGGGLDIKKFLLEMECTHAAS